MAVILDESEWRERERKHRTRVTHWTVPHLRRRTRGEKQPVFDFLFQYYSFSPAQLERWHPGPNTILTGQGVEKFLDEPSYRPVDGGVAVDDEAFTAKRERTTRALLVLLTATASRRPRLSCFGLHEWAMVYRQDPALIRHNQLPLRLGSAGTDTVVESLTINCGHYDAFRFFTKPARGRNEFQPTRETQTQWEQPGCLHANMDLYKAAYKLSPFIPAELVADCFALAVRIRELDMRASPYDLTSYGYQPVAIETPSGRAEYVRAQAEFAHSAEPLRERLISSCRELLAGRE